MIFGIHVGIGNKKAKMMFPFVTSSRIVFVKELRLSKSCIMLRGSVYHTQSIPRGGDPVVWSPIDCVSLRSYWGADHSATRHLHSSINKLLMHAVAVSVRQQRSRKPSVVGSHEKPRLRSTHRRSSGVLVIIAEGHHLAPSLCVLHFPLGGPAFCYMVMLLLSPILAGFEF